MKFALRKDKMINQEKDQHVRRMKSKEGIESCCVTGNHYHKGQGGLGPGCKLVESVLG